MLTAAFMAAVFCYVSEITSVRYLIWSLFYGPPDQRDNARGGVS